MASTPLVPLGIDQARGECSIPASLFDFASINGTSAFLSLDGSLLSTFSQSIELRVFSLAVLQPASTVVFLETDN